MNEEVNDDFSPLGLTVAKAAKRLGVSPATLRRWADDGFVHSYRTPGGQRRFEPQELDAFLRKLKKGEVFPPDTTST